MAKAYPAPIRRKVLQMIARDCLPIAHVARIMHISRKTIYSWLASETLRPRGRPRKLRDLLELSQLVARQPHMPITEIANRLNLSRQTVYHYLREIEGPVKAKNEEGH